MIFFFNKNFFFFRLFFYLIFKIFKISNYYFYNIKLIKKMNIKNHIL